MNNQFGRGNSQFVTQFTGGTLRKTGTIRNLAKIDLVDTQGFDRRSDGVYLKARDFALVKGFWPVVWTWVGSDL